MHRIRMTTAALVSVAALTVTGAPVAAHAAAPADSCAKQQTQVDNAQKALDRVTAVFAKQQTRVKHARAELKHADNRSEKAKARAELHAAKVKKEKVAKAKKAQQQRLAKATTRLDACQSAGGGTTA